ncbi:MAG: ComEC/Rec2 family competence protein, partial [Mycobacteriales bacterium]
MTTGVFAPDTRADLTAATLSISGSPRLLGQPSWQQRAAGSLRDGLRDAAGTVPQPAGGLIPALAVGDTSALDSQLVEQFQITGMTHLTAVSGANLALVIGAVLLVARRVGVGVKSCTVLGAVALVGFVILARPSPSVLRAAVMAGIGLAALALGRSRAAFPALALAVIGLLCYDPALAVSPGFALSVFATAGLVLLAPRWSRVLRRRAVPRPLADALAVPAAAQLACAPLIAALAGSVSLVAVPANLLASLAVGPVTVLGVLCALASVLPGVGEPVATGLAWLAGWPARWLVAIAEHGADLRYAELSWPSGLHGALLLAALVLLAAVALRYRACRWSCAALVAGLLLVLLPMQVVQRPWPPDGWVMVMCDVGQGDAAVVRVGKTSAMVVDAGPDPSLVDRCLTRLRISHIALFVLSHPHADHVGGISGVSRGRRVAAVMGGDPDNPGVRESVAGYRRFTHWVDRTGSAKLNAQAGSSHVVGDATVTVLGPVEPLTGTRSDPNNNSVVLLVRVAGVSILFPGDVENAAQLDLIAGNAVPEVDVLKVPHHGSPYSEPQFFDAASARAALVSVGADNDYGHPSGAVLRKLRAGGAHVARTDRQGDIAVIASSGGVTVAHHGTR